MLHRKLPDHWALLSGSEPFDGYSFESKNIQIIFNNTNIGWADELKHCHEYSDEIYIVLDGSMSIFLGGITHHVAKDEYFCVPKGVLHKLESVETPHKSFVIRGPSIKDKVVFK